MSTTKYNVPPLVLSFIGITSILFGLLVAFTVVLASLFPSFLAIQSAPLNSGVVTSLGLIYSIVGAILVSYDAVAGTGVLAQLSWYLKHKEKSLFKRWLIIFYLLSPPLDREESQFNEYLNDIEQGRDMKSADFSNRAAGERARVTPEYDQFRSIQRPAVIKSFGFTFIFIGFLMQFSAVNVF